MILEILLLTLGIIGGALLLRWLLTFLVTLYVESPLRTGFYSSLSSTVVRQRQAEVGLKIAQGPGWAHLGWIADPDTETYRIDQDVDGMWRVVERTRLGSYLVAPPGGSFRVWACPKDGRSPRLLGEVSLSLRANPARVHIPRVAGEWQMLFQPSQAGDYINDHTIYRDAAGNWRLAGITSRTDGDYNAERSFAVGVSPDFPPAGGMREEAPIEGDGDLAWAPHVIWSEGKYHLFWSPHRLHQMVSDDGVTWEDHQVTITAPYHKFFRDPWVVEVAPGQWLLYTTAKAPLLEGGYSQIDIYQSFDLHEWQYIRSALRSGRGSERNAPFASMESPAVFQYEGRWYLGLTYNNDSGFLHALLMLVKRWPKPETYNDTLIFSSTNPYDFGLYRGQRNSPSLVTRLRAHAPDFVFVEGQGWFITTAGWPWVATLTRGEVAVAPLVWD